MENAQWQVGMVCFLPSARCIQLLCAAELQERGSHNSTPGSGDARAASKQCVQEGNLRRRKRLNSLLWD